MRRLFLVIMIGFMAMVNIGLYAQGKDTTQAEIKLELIWEKEFPEGIVDVAFDKDRDGLFCPNVVVTGNNENAKAILYLDSEGKIEKTMKLKEWSQVRISENGKYIGIMHPEKWDKEFHYGHVDIINLSGKLVKRIEEVYGSRWWVSPKGNEVIEKYPWTNDDIYYFRGTSGKSKANLTKREGDISEFAGLPAIKWTGSENKYLQIGNKCVTASLDGKYVAFVSYVSKGNTYVDHLLLYTKDGVLLKDFNLNKQGFMRASFSVDGKFLAATVKNLVFLIDVEKKEILWRYKSNDPYQLLNLGTTPDFSSDSLFYLAGVFWHYEKQGSKNPSEKIIIFSKKGNIILDSLIGESLNRMEKLCFKVNKKGNMLCYVTPHKIRVFKLRGIK